MIRMTVTNGIRLPLDSYYRDAAGLPVTVDWDDPIEVIDFDSKAQLERFLVYLGMTARSARTTAHRLCEFTVSAGNWMNVLHSEHIPTDPMTVRSYRFAQI